MNHEILNTAWLKAWSDKDVPRLLAFYAEDTVYKDNQTVAGIKGHVALRDYLTGLFNATPKMIYTPDEIWPTHNGYCGRWYCTIGDDGKQGGLRGFDLVVLDANGKIALNEVYVHPL